MMRRRMKMDFSMLPTVEKTHLGRVVLYWNKFFSFTCVFLCYLLIWILFLHFFNVSGLAMCWLDSLSFLCMYVNIYVYSWSKNYVISDLWITKISTKRDNFPSTAFFLFLGFGIGLVFYLLFLFQRSNF